MKHITYDTQPPVIIKPAKFKIVSKFKKGQNIYAINDGKIVSGKITGYKHAIISDRNYILNHTEYEINTYLSNYVWANEENCYTSQRSLITAIKQK